MGGSPAAGAAQRRQAIASSPPAALPGSQAAALAADTWMRVFYNDTAAQAVIRVAWFPMYTSPLFAATRVKCCPEGVKGTACRNAPDVPELDVAGTGAGPLALDDCFRFSFVVTEYQMQDESDTDGAAALATQRVSVKDASLAVVWGDVEAILQLPYVRGYDFASPEVAAYAGSANPFVKRLVKGSDYRIYFCI